MEMFSRLILFIHAHHILQLTKKELLRCHSGKHLLCFSFFHSCRWACQLFEVNIIFSVKQVLYPFLVSLCNVHNAQDNKSLQNIKNITSV